MTSDRQIVAVPVDGPTDGELVADRLFALGASAVSELSDGAGVVLVADLSSRALDRLDRPVRLVEHDPSWGAAWQEHATTIRAGRHLVVRPMWVTSDARPDEVEIVVAAAEAFGSGSHPTTRMCLAAVERLVRPGDRVLDVGCGSGVLGVAALLLGARSLTAVDVDPVAVEATMQTARVNGVSHAVDASGWPLCDVTGTYDLVVANLLVPIIEELGTELAAAVAPGGSVVLSGVLADQVDRAVAAVGLPVVRLDRDGPWAALTLTTRRDRPVCHRCVNEV